MPQVRSTEPARSRGSTRRQGSFGDPLAPRRRAGGGGEASMQRAGGAGWLRSMLFGRGCHQLCQTTESRMHLIIDCGRRFGPPLP
jgi:hypothetical protein